MVTVGKEKVEGQNKNYTQESIICVYFPAGAVEIKVLPLSFRPENGQDSDTCPDLHLFRVASLALWLSMHNNGKYLS